MKIELRIVIKKLNLMWQSLRKGSGTGFYLEGPVDSHPVSLEASRMLQILDLISLVRLAGCEQ